MLRTLLDGAQTLALRNQGSVSWTPCGSNHFCTSRQQSILKMPARCMWAAGCCWLLLTRAPLHVPAEWVSAAAVCGFMYTAGAVLVRGLQVGNWCMAQCNSTAALSSQQVY